MDQTEAVHLLNDPALDPGVLGQIATEQPALRAAVAVHPSAYPGLLGWLAALGDPAVDAALAARRPAQPVGPPAPAPPAPPHATPGHPATAPGHPATYPGYSTGHQGGPGVFPGGPGGYYGPSSPRPNPFAGVPVADYVTDAVAALLLLLSLALPWDAAHGASSRVEVVLITIVSVLSLTVHYLARAGALPATMPAGMIRLLANVPYVALATVYIVIELVASFTDGYGGVGSALVLGLTGAVLAAMPRRAELTGPAASAAARSGRVWLLAVPVAVGFTVLLQVVGLGRLVTELDAYQTPVPMVIAFVLATATWAWITVRPAVGMLRGQVAWSRVLLAAGVSVAVWQLVESSSSSFGYHSTTALLSSSGGALVLLPAIAAICVSPAVQSHLAERGEVLGWFRTVDMAWVYLAVIAGAEAVQFVLDVVWGLVSNGVAIALVLLAVLMAVAAVVGRAAFVRDPVGGLGVALVATGVVALLGLVAVIIQSTQVYLGVGAQILLIAFGLPLLVGYALLAPASVRAHRAQVRPAVQAQYQQAQYQQAPFSQAPFSQSADRPPAPPAAPNPPTPATPPSPEATATVPGEPIAPVHGFTAVQAADPGTELSVLAEIAARAPELRARLAANPSAYPALLEWLAAIGDPAIDAALAARTD